MREWVRDQIFSREFLTRPWIDRKLVSATWKAFEAGDPHAASTTWKWVSLEMWARVFLDGKWRTMLPVETSPHARVRGAEAWA
jgi:hypothetical protein